MDFYVLILYAETLLNLIALTGFFVTSLVFSLYKIM